MISKYVKIDLDKVKVKVNLEHDGNFEVLELNIVLPESINTVKKPRHKLWGFGLVIQSSRDRRVSYMAAGTLDHLLHLGGGIKLNQFHSWMRVRKNTEDFIGKRLAH